ncbi:MAG: hypothetical protein K5905_01680 [Roseibium sp.]|uniref:hypothetical protein n=1 Tax=Roseibium sp. TaxID=1936156 RepID=UPI0026285320|nr:hypothetical protein [Roseibium sp.]MCV0424160.1 hypothetical protein [Roseibium sp.]
MRKNTTGTRQSQPVPTSPRLTNRARSVDQRELIHRIKGLISQFKDSRDLRMMGGFQPAGADQLETVCRFMPKIYEALRQRADQLQPTVPFAELEQALSDAS